MVPELGVMFDVGRCPPGSMKYDTLLLSHGHQDHAGGLPYAISQRGMMRKPPLEVHCPEEIVEPLQRIVAAWSAIEDFELRVDLRGHAPGDRFKLRKDLEVETIRTSHRVPSLAYVVTRITSRLASEYRGRPGHELSALREAGHVITEEVRTPILGVTGDTRIDTFVASALLQRCEVLVHEVTAWDDRRSVEQTRQWGHTHVDEMIDHVDRFEGRALVLVHRSMRHPRSQAQRVVDERFPESIRARVHLFGG